MKDKKAFSLFIQELENDFRFIQSAAEMRTKAELRVEASRWNDELDLMVLGGYLHSLYNAIEAYFLRIAKFFENNVDQHTWHRDLLDRMTLEIPEVRPALLFEAGLIERIDELRRFRHLFRNLYKTRLRADKLGIVNQAARNIDTDFLEPHRSFIAWLNDVSAAMEAQ
jgi:hypothetical protein